MSQLVNLFMNVSKLGTNKFEIVEQGPSLMPLKALEVWRNQLVHANAFE